MTEDKKLNDVKAEIRSLIVSSPVGLTVWKFLREYIERIGRPLPHKEFGFDNVHDFLSNLQDVVRIECTDRGPVLVPVRNEQVAHINDLVQHQKKQKPANNFCRRLQKPSMINSQDISDQKPVQGMNASDSTTIEENMVVEEDTISNCTIQNEEANSSNTPPMIDTVDMSNFIPVSLQDDNADKKNEQLETSANNSSHLSDIGRVASPIDSISNDQISDKMKENFRLILQENSKGISASKLCSVYKEKFGCPLVLQDLGFNSLRELILSLPNIFTFEKTKFSHDWTLFDARITPKKKGPKDALAKWIPYNVLDNIVQLSRKYPSGIKAEDVLKLYEKTYSVRIDIKKLGYESVGSFLVNCTGIQIKILNEECVIFPKYTANLANNVEQSDSMNALPPPENMKFLWKDYFSDDVCDPTCNYKKFILTETVQMRVCVSDIHSPDAIWLQPIENKTRLTNMMFELNMFYDDVESQYLMPENVIKPGVLCCVRFHLDKRWYRSRVLEVNLGKIKVCYVDYGTINYELSCDIRFLHKKFLEDPIHVVRAKLHNLVPMGGETEWPTKTNFFLFDRLYTKTFYATILDIDETLPQLSVMLIDTNEEEDVNIHDVLIEEGLATSTACLEIDVGNEIHHDSGNNVGLNRVSDLFLDVLQKLLPAWLIDSSGSKDIQGIRAMFAEVQNFVDNSNSIPTELQMCCTSHFVRTLFYTDPENISKIWHNVISKNMKHLYQDFLKDITAFASLEDKYFRLSPFCEKYSSEFCSSANDNMSVQNLRQQHSSTSDMDPSSILEGDGDYSEDAWEKFMKLMENHHIAEKWKEQRTSMDDSSEVCRSKFPPPGYHKETFENNINRTCQSPYMEDEKEMSYSSKTATSKSRPSSQAASHHSQGASYSEMTLLRCELDNEKLVYEARIPGGKSLLVVKLVNLLYVVREQLLRDFIRGIPTMLLQHRTNKFTNNSENIVVTGITHPCIYRSLKACAVTRDSQAVLIPLHNVSNFFKTITPHDKATALFFDHLAKIWSADQMNN